jgi:hypothetical protein
VAKKSKPYNILIAFHKSTESVAPTVKTISASRYMSN